MLGHYLPFSREGEREIWGKARVARAAAAADVETLPDDVRVEDAGLDDDEVLPRDTDDQAPTPRQSSLARGSIARRAATHVAVGVVA